jgi:hypothetical protein
MIWRLFLQAGKRYERKPDPAVGRLVGEWSKRGVIWSVAFVFLFPPDYRRGTPK